MAAYLAILVLPVDAWALLPLEDRLARPAEPIHVDGIIVLSGAVDAELTRDRGIRFTLTPTEALPLAVSLADPAPARQRQ